MLVLFACAPEVAVPEFGETFSVMVTADDGLANPRDLEFNPEVEGELWIVNQETNGTVIVHDAGNDAQTSEERVDVMARHFMADVSSIAFGAPGTFATCQESRDDWNGVDQVEDDFMGPTLWSSDLEVYCEVGQGGGAKEGSHLDMLHESPWCMGIAHEADNVYWVYDGLHGDIVRYDFQEDHGPGGSDHTDGIIHRYTDAVIARVEGVSSHMQLVEDGWLYVADTGSGQIMRLDTASGELGTRDLPNWDGLSEYRNVNDSSWEVWMDGFSEPSGLLLSDDRLFVSDHATGEIVAFDMDGAELGRITTSAEGIMGLAHDGERLWYADAAANEVLRVDP